MLTNKRYISFLVSAVLESRFTGQPLAAYCNMDWMESYGARVMRIV